MLKIESINIDTLKPKLDRLWQLAHHKISMIDNRHGGKTSAPVFTVEGKYTAKGWTDWTQGFQYGSALAVYDATNEEDMLTLGAHRTLSLMAPHLTHTGVHDHGFNTMSTYGHLLRLILEGRASSFEQYEEVCKMAVSLSGAVQASRWVESNLGGYIYSFNGPQSLFIDTVRSVRVLFASHVLGHHLSGEQDQKINLFHRGLAHMLTTAKANIYYGEGRDHYDLPGRVAHESIFNTNNGVYRCPSTQQGYSAFSTWTRGLAWAILGYAEQLEVLSTLAEKQQTSDQFPHLDEAIIQFEKSFEACAQFYIHNTPNDGVPYWDTGAPGLAYLADYLDRTSDPYNAFEPIDSSAAAIAVQGFLRMSNYYSTKGNISAASIYNNVGLTILNTLLEDPYLSKNDQHEGLLLHSVYHRPNSWDYTHQGQSIPNGESCMWGDYHLLEAALLVHKKINKINHFITYLPL
jgi:unsaturated chondroitin disaccharide hydrolase